ncbi:AbrB/MazE/SpoVT family DNA-binding domain-containing protein [Romboutsia sp. 1001216sp1]|uniref:AbrB/MazE/SpoVT family DNA-binding domain-containing protein n=1 Tax=Romboutsia sp. 1001216sp1 TaxID=2986997 RepID=UPI00232FDC9E|nr:AbrB/MazE/SpoVT family DNA-binding domain-containing protein [Romboutsia sp. 1001216sp1]MDB8791704.1 AbrB/MazE/SpoVT family DNA-binding domain-containing protein [Romboutsia sp. 1001216sp1]
MKETRELKISFQKSGVGSQTNRVTIPTSWIREMNITEDDRNVEVTFNKNDKTITIRKK